MISSNQDKENHWLLNKPSSSPQCQFISTESYTAEEIVHISSNERVKEATKDINKVDKMQFQKSGYKNTFTDSTNESSIHSNER
ncbi:hypothetical protein DEO72_LG3g249 [Vigna unguiculata]|uniref:Uncharacterized protein n=1 Tax=Vigna unguiculata TaxID=3917 RepID=A0A4D6LB27_VIGUN|nr:hypothetical protein DEO72_LG3g249 [Vigna unguiculata]